MMEIERLKAVQFFEQKEKIIADLKKQGAAVVIDQIR